MILTLDSLCDTMIDLSILCLHSLASVIFNYIIMSCYRLIVGDKDACSRDHVCIVYCVSNR